MYQKNHFVLFLLFFILFFANKNSFAQESYNSTVLDDYSNLKRLEAEQNINNLKEGALLIRLKTRSKSLKAYEKAGATHLIKRIKKERDAENKKIIDLFNKYFDFCPTYFFYTDDTELLLLGKHEGMFLNNELKKDKNIILDKDFYLIAEFDVLLEEKLWTDSTLTATNQNKVYQHQALNKVIVIKDKNLEQLKDPFPFYVKASTERFWPRKVEKLNKRFHKYFETKKALPADSGE